MWICLNNAFLSIVAHRDQPEMLLVRGRREGDIEAVFPDAEVSVTPRADYLCRAVIPREVVADVIATQAQGIPYDNFKASVRDGALHDAYLSMWGVMRRLQGIFRS